jgi:hypothetical protein
MLLLMGMLGWVLLGWWKDLRRRPAASRGYWLLPAGIAILLGILVTGFIEYNLGDSEVLVMTLAVIGAVEAGRRSPAPSELAA